MGVIDIWAENMFRRYGEQGSSATCSIALAEAVEQGRVKEEDVVILVSFGSCLAVSGAAIRL